jgi:transposase
MGQGRRQFTDEFKREAVALLASSGRLLIQIAAELGIAPSMLRNWRGRSGGRNAGPALRPNTPGAGPAFRPGPGGRSPGCVARTIGCGWNATF